MESILSATPTPKPSAQSGVGALATAQSGIATPPTFAQSAYVTSAFCQPPAAAQSGVVVKLPKPAVAQSGIVAPSSAAQSGVVGTSKSLAAQSGVGAQADEAGADAPNPDADVDMDAPSLSAVDPDSPLNGVDDCFDEKFSIKDRDEKITQVFDAVGRRKKAWVDSGSQVCSACGKKHPPPCFATPEGIAFKAFRKKALKVRARAKGQARDAEIASSGNNATKDPVEPKAAKGKKAPPKRESSKKPSSNEEASEAQRNIAKSVALADSLSVKDMSWLGPVLRGMNQAKRKAEDPPPKSEEPKPKKGKKKEEKRKDISPDFEPARRQGDGDGGTGGPAGPGMAESAYARR